jgi:hypothetical protein
MAPAHITVEVTEGMASLWFATSMATYAAE